MSIHCTAPYTSLRCYSASRSCCSSPGSLDSPPEFPLPSPPGRESRRLSSVRACTLGIPSDPWRHLRKHKELHFNLQFHCKPRCGHISPGRWSYQHTARCRTHVWCVPAEVQLWPLCTVHSAVTPPPSRFSQPPHDATGRCSEALVNAHLTPPFHFQHRKRRGSWFPLERAGKKNDISRRFEICSKWEEKNSDVQSKFYHWNQCSTD